MNCERVFAYSELRGCEPTSCTQSPRYPIRNGKRVVRGAYDPARGLGVS